MKRRQVPFRIDDDDYDGLAAMSLLTGRSMGDLVRAAIRKEIDLYAESAEPSTQIERLKDARGLMERWSEKRRASVAP